jgi:DNA transformation protein
MFGGVGLYHHGIFFGLIDDDTLYLKVDDSNRTDFERAGSRPFQPYGEGSYSMQYYELPAEALEDRAAIREWVLKSVAAQKSATAKRKRPRK